MNLSSSLPFFLGAVLTLLPLHSCFGDDPAAPPNLGVMAPKMQHLVDENVMAGAVMLVGYQDKIVDLEAVGYSDLDAKTPMRTDDLFWIASMSKPMTVAAFMMLVDEGKVSLDDPVDKYIPEFKDVQFTQADGKLAPPTQPILIRQILSHTAGLPFMSKQCKGKIDCFSLENVVKFFAQEPLIYDPGTKWVYSNEGIDTAGRIIEIVSGQSYEQFLQERLLNPLGMVDTTFRPNASQLLRLAKSYQPNPAKNGIVETPIVQVTYPLDAASRYPSPPGGLFSTARDTYRFCQMLADGGTFEGKTYLSKDAVHQMTIKQTGPNVPNKYGFALEVSGDGNFFGHGGAYRTHMGVDHGKITIFLVQQGGSGWWKDDPFKEFNAAARLVDVGHPNSSSGESPTPVGMQPPAP